LKPARGACRSRAVATCELEALIISGESPFAATFIAPSGRTGPEAAGLTMAGATASYIVAANEERIETKAKV
jgi:hypothetical protein